MDMGGDNSLLAMLPAGPRSALQPQMRFGGPAIVTEFDSTTVVLPGYTAEVDVNFNILINPDN